LARHAYMPNVRPIPIEAEDEAPVEPLPTPISYEALWATEQERKREEAEDQAARILPLACCPGGRMAWTGEGEIVCDWCGSVLGHYKALEPMYSSRFAILADNWDAISDQTECLLEIKVSKYGWA